LDNFIQLAIAWATGFIAGFLVSMPIGPINITIINEGARSGFLRAWMVGLGAVTMDIVYCGVGFAGFSHLFESHLLKASMELVSFLLLTFLGVKYWRTAAINKTSKSADALEQRIHQTTAYMTGLVRVIGNPGVLLLWITLSAAAMAHELVDPPVSSRTACVVGVGLGATAWFTLLSYGMARGKGKFSDATLIHMARFSGLLLMGGAVLVGYRMVRLLAAH
jgi:L-lysine exporter family protein LysE/ArgO